MKEAPQKLLYAYTSQLHDLLKDASESDYKKIHEILFHYIREYEKANTSHNAWSVAAGWHAEIEKEIEIGSGTRKFKDQIQCKKGCAFCCHQNVDITREEAHLLIGHCLSAGIEIDWDTLAKQSNVQHYKDWRNRKCVFLADDNTCKVYEHRPASCRKLHVITPPSICDNTTVQDGVGYVINLIAEIITSAAWNASTVQNLPNALLKAKAENLNYSE